MRLGFWSFLGALLLFVEAVGLGCLAVWQIVEMFHGDTASLPTALALLVLTMIGAALIAAFGFALLQQRSWARSGGIVIQVLILAVAFGSINSPGSLMFFSLFLALPAATTLLVLLGDSRAAAKKKKDSMG